MKALRVAPFVAILFVWWLLTDVMDLYAPVILPSPSATFRFVWSAAEQGDLLQAVWGSLSRFLYGLVIGAALATPLGIVLARNRRSSDVLMPFIKFFQAIAGVTWIPLAVLWFGISTRAAVFIIVNTTFFVVLYAVMTGIRTIPPVLLQAVRTLGGTLSTEVRHVLMPGALPHVLTGVRIAVGYGWRTLIAAEIISSGRGLGVMIWEGQQRLNTAQIFAALILIGLISFSMDRFLLRPIERATVERWGLATSKA